MSIVVSDTSPIRALDHLRLLELLETLFGEILIPPAVVIELEKPRLRFARIVVSEVAFLRVVAPADRGMVDDLQMTLDPGEAEAIALAIEVGADTVLLDEAAGRDVARQRGLFPIGILGVLLQAKRQGFLDSIRPLLDRLEVELGFFISRDLRHEVLKTAEEED